MRQQLAIRVDAANPDHHPWNDHGTWWIHDTLHPDGVRVHRVRCPLATADLETARQRRDALLAAGRRGVERAGR